MSTESELERWRAAWTASGLSEARPPFDIGSAFRRQERSLRARYVGNLCAAVVFLALPVFVLRNNADPETILWSVVVWLTTLGSTAFVIWNWRMVWKGGGESVTDFAAMYRKRSLATIRAARFGYGFLALQLAITVPWLTYDFMRGQIPVARYAFALTILAGFTASFLVRFRRSISSAKRELANIDAFCGSL